ncbi:MAG: MMPL family transporter [bacterium]
MKTFVRKYFNLAQNHCFSVFLILLIIFIVQIFHVAASFRMDTDLTALFRGDNPTIKELEKVEDRMGTFENMLIVSESSNFEKNKKFMDALRTVILDTPLVTAIEYERDVSVIEDHVLLYLPLEELEKHHDEIDRIIKKETRKRMWSVSGEQDKESDSEIDGKFEKTLDRVFKTLEKQRRRHNITRYSTAGNGRFLTMKVRPSGSATDVNDIKNLRHFISEKVSELDPEKYGVKVEVGGRLDDKVKEMNAMTADLMTVLLLCVIMLTFIIVFYFRTLLSFFIIMLPLTAGILFSLSVTLLFIDKLNIVSAFSYVVLYGLGIDFGIHLLSRYGEEKQRYKDVRKALSVTMEEVVPAMFSGAVTTSVAFASLMLLDFKGFFDYGFIAAVGVLAAFFAFVLFFPVFILMTEFIVSVRVRPRKLAVLFYTYRTFNKIRKPILSVAFMMVLISIFVMLNAPFEYNLNKLRFEQKEKSIQPDESSIIKRYNKVAGQEERDVFSRGLSAIYLTGSQQEAESLTRHLEILKKRHRKDRNRIKGILSLQTFIPTEQDKKLNVIKKTRNLIRRKKNLLNKENLLRVEKEIMPLLHVPGTISADDLPLWIKDKFREKNGDTGKVVMLLTSGNKNDIKNVRKIKELYGTISPDKGKKFKMSGAFLLLSDIYTVLHRDVPISGGLALLAVFITLMIMFRSIRKSITVLLPLVCGFLWMFTLARVLNIEFNLFNMVIVPTVLGIGIDSSIHLYHRYLSHRSQAGISHTLATTGGAVLFSALTTFVGFFSLVFSDHRGISSMGQIAAVGIVTVTTASLILFPILLSVFHSKKSSKKQ